MDSSQVFLYVIFYSVREGIFSKKLVKLVNNFQCKFTLQNVNHDVNLSYEGNLEIS